MAEQLQDGEFWLHVKNKVVNFVCLIDFYHESVQILEQGWRDVERLRDYKNPVFNHVLSLALIGALLNCIT